MSDEELLETLKLDAEEGGITKRNRKRVESLREKAETLRKYFRDSGADVDVREIINTGFNSLGFISISGKSVSVFDREIIDLIRQDVSYVNIIADNPAEIVFELGYANLSQE